MFIMYIKTESREREIEKDREREKLFLTMLKLKAYITGILYVVNVLSISSYHKTN